MERRLLLDVVVREGAAVFKLLAREDQALLVRRDALLVLDLWGRGVVMVRYLFLAHVCARVCLWVDIVYDTHLRKSVAVVL